MYRCVLKFIKTDNNSYILLKGGPHNLWQRYFTFFISTLSTGCRHGRLQKYFILITIPLENYSELRHPITASDKQHSLTWYKLMSNHWMRLSKMWRNMQKYVIRRGWWPRWITSSRDLHNSSNHTKVWFNNCFII